MIIGWPMKKSHTAANVCRLAIMQATFYSGCVQHTEIGFRGLSRTICVHFHDFLGHRPDSMTLQAWEI